MFFFKVMEKKKEVIRGTLTRNDIKTKQELTPQSEVRDWHIGKTIKKNRVALLSPEW